MRVPPPGSEPSAIVDFVDTLVIESFQEERRQAWLTEAERALNLYIGNHFETAAPSDQIRIVLNRVQNVVVSLVAIQGGDKPKITFTPRESGEPPVCYLNTQIPEGRAMAAALAMNGALTDPDQPLDDNLAEFLKQKIEFGQQQAALAMQMGLPPPPTIPEKVLVEVTDATSAHALQTLFDAAWEESDAGFVYCENILNKNVLGWQPTLYEFLDDEKKHQLTNVHPKHVFPDPIMTDSSRWQYVVYDQPVSVEEAKKKFPNLAKKLDEEWSDPGRIIFSGNRVYDPASMYQENFQRDMVVIRTAWLRFQPYPMPLQQALNKGRVREVENEPQAVLPGGAPADQASVVEATA
jgi:hypothetical protein